MHAMAANFDAASAPSFIGKRLSEQANEMKLNRINPAALTATKLSKALARINDGGGLALLPNYKSKPGEFSGIHRWVFRATLAGKVFEMGFGTLAEVSLADARARAIEARQQVGRGEDPRAERQDKRAAERQAIEDAQRARAGLPVVGSFKDWTLRYVDKQAGSWGAPEASRTEWLGPAAMDDAGKPVYTGQMGNHVFPTLGDVKIEAIERPQLAALLAGIEGTSAMHAVRKKVNQVLRFAKLSGALKENVCEDIQHVLPKHIGGNNPAVKTAEALADVLNKFAAFGGGQVMKTAMMVQAYLFQRSDVSASMEWAHVNLKRGIWTVPAGNMKRDAEGKINGADHIVPLPRQIVAMLEALQPVTGAGRFVFPNAVRADDHMTADAINNAMQSALGKRRGQEWNSYQTAHGFRALGISFGQKYCGEDKRVLDLIAGHAIGDNLGTAYERNQWEEERGPAAQAYADWLDAICAGTPDAFLTHGERERARMARTAAPEAANAPTVDAAQWARFLAFEAAERAAAGQQAA